MEKRQLKGTTEWAEYSITLPVHPQAKQLFFGVLLAGTGKAWADDLQLLLNGKPLWQAPKVERPQTVIDTDHEFDRGSGISIAELSNSQVDNLVTLGKVWGFLKYYHPKVTSGQIHWDYALFRVLPTVLAAKDHAAANAVLLNWVNSLGPIAQCSPCAKLNNSDLDFGPDLDWISNEALLGADLSKALLSIRDNRSPDQQFYASKAPMIGNPVFDHEPSYADLKLPDAGFQLLSVYRFWNIVEYWSPYRNILGENWNAILAEFIPRVALAKSVVSYKQEMLALVAEAHDGHANVWNALDARPPI
jgi:hypothetical protein